MKVKDLETKLKHCYGENKGHRVYQTIVPGILADFLRMYGSARMGSPVKEEYKLEDGSGSIILSAMKTVHPAEIEAAFIYGNK